MATPARLPPALAAALLLAGCGLPQSAAPPVPPPVSAAPQPPSRAGAWAWTPRLESAGTQLRSALSGSGVELSQTQDQRLWISLPAGEAFAPGRSALTPAATAWLDRVAASLRGIPRAQWQIVAPADARGGAALAVDRAAAVRDWLVTRGVPAQRMAVSGAPPRGPASGSGEARVEILVGERAPS